MVTVVLDTDFLSSFLKIDSLHRVRDYFQVEKLLVPTAVFREVAVTSLTPRLTAVEWLEARTVAPVALAKTTEAGGSDFAELGPGEQEAIALALHRKDPVLLMNDRLALRCARGLGIHVVNVPAFLLMYRVSGQEAANQVREMVVALEEKDHYGFPEGIRRSLLAE